MTLSDDILTQHIEIQDSRRDRAVDVASKYMSQGLSSEEIGKQLRFPPNEDPDMILGTFAISQTYKLDLGTARMTYPFVKEKLLGLGASDAAFTKHLYTNMKPFKIGAMEGPTEAAKAGVEAATGEFEEFKTEKEAAPPEDPFTQQMRQASSIMSGPDAPYVPTAQEQYYSALETHWFGKAHNRDKSKEKYYNSLYEASTELERIEAKETYFGDLMADRQKELSQFANWENIQREITEPSPIPFEFKLPLAVSGGALLGYALASEETKKSKSSAAVRAIATAGSATYTAAQVAVNGASRVWESDSLKDLAESNGEMSRGFWQTLSTPELHRVDRGHWDGMTNSFIENSPYTGLAIGMSAAAPGATTALASVFGLSLMYEGNIIKQTALDNGFSNEEANARMWIGGTISALIETASGGATKYVPSKSMITKIASYPKRLGKVALAEIFKEELPQEIVGAIFSNDIPYDDNGEIDWNEVSNRVMLLARDTAFNSIVWSSTTTGITKTAELAGLSRSPISQEDASMLMQILAFMDDERGSQKNPFIGKPRDEGAEKPTEPAAEEVAEPEPAPPVTPEPDVDLIQEIKDAPQYFVQMTGTTKKKGERYVVMDGDTQQEVKRNLNKKQAIEQAKGLNTGAIEDNRRGSNKWLPTYETMVDMSIADMWKFVEGQTATQAAAISKQGKASKEALKALETRLTDEAKFAVAMNKDLVAWGQKELSGLSITKGQHNQMMRMLAAATTATDRLNIAKAIGAIKEQQRRAVALSKIKQLQRYIRSRPKGTIKQKFMDAVKVLTEPYTHLTAKHINALERTGRHLESLRKDIVDRGFDAKYAELLIPQDLIDAAEKAKNLKPFKDMNAEEMEAFVSQLQNILQLNKLYSGLSLARKVRETKDWLNNLVANVKAKKATKPITKSRKPLSDSAFKVWDTMMGMSKDDIYTTITKIWGHDGLALEMEIMGARRKQMGAYLEMVGTIGKIINDNNITTKDLAEWSPSQQKWLPKGLGQQAKEMMGASVKYYNIEVDGVTRQFTMAELISFYMHLQNSYNFRQIRNNGIAVLRGVLGKATKDVMAQVVDIVEANPKALGFAQGLEALYLRNADNLNELSLRLWGFNIAEVDNYFHIQYVKEEGVTGQQYVRDRLFDQDGRFKPRTSSSRHVVIADVFAVIMEDMTVTADFVGLTETMQRLRSLSNYLPFKDKLKGNSKLRQLKRFNELITAMQAVQSPQDVISQFVAKMGSGLAKATLINPKIWAVQAGSYVLYFSETELKYMTTARAGTADIKDALQNWVMYQYRKGGFSSSHSVASAVGARNVTIGRGSASDEGLSPLHFVDMKTVSQSARITLAEMGDNNLEGKALRWWTNYGVDPQSLKYGTDKFWAAFNDRADYLVTLTQPMFGPENRDSHSNSKNQLVREMSRFRSFVNQMLRIPTRKMALWQNIVTDADGIKHREISTRELVQDTSSSVALSVAVSTIIRYVVGMLLGQDKEAEELLTDMVTQPLAWIPFLGYPIQRIGQQALGREVMTPDFSTLSIAMMDSLILHSSEIAQGLRFSLDDETFEGGPNKGKFKSNIYLRRGIGGMARDTLIITGAPVRAVEQVEWFDE